jgi:thiol-disulfide isomerase/thioredoxin
MSNQTILTLYMRVGCHLCETMQQQLAVLQQQYHFSINIIDIDADNDLRMRYGGRIPVVAMGEQEICHYYLNEAAVRKCLKAL